MNPFEDLIRELGAYMDIPLVSDQHQSCLLHFPQDDVSVQIELNTNADQILIGTQLGTLQAGPYREQILAKAMRMNGIAQTRRGTLAYSEKNNALVLFQFLPLADMNGEKLFHFLQLFIEHASIWKKALTAHDIPFVEGDALPETSRLFGLR